MNRRNALIDMLSEPPQPQRNRLTDFLDQPSTADVHRTLDQTVTNRGNFVPLVEYASGRVGPGWPNFLPGHKVADMLTPGYDYDSPQAARDAFDVAGAVGVGSLAAPKPSNAIGAFGARVPRGGFEIDYFGTPVQIVQNPSKQQMAALIGKTKYKAVRRLQDADGNTYIWDAADPALHDLVAESLGLSKGTFTGDMLGID